MTTPQPPLLIPQEKDTTGALSNQASAMFKENVHSDYLMLLAETPAPMPENSKNTTKTQLIPPRAISDETRTQIHDRVAGRLSRSALSRAKTQIRNKRFTKSNSPKFTARPNLCLTGNTGQGQHLNREIEPNLPQHSTA